jgi:hypothetical protein
MRQPFVKQVRGRFVKFFGAAVSKYPCGCSILCVAPIALDNVIDLNK